MKTIKKTTFEKQKFTSLKALAKTLRQINYFADNYSQNNSFERNYTAHFHV